MKKQQEECPKCHQFKLENKKGLYLAMAFLSLLWLSLTLPFVVVLFWIVSGVPFVSIATAFTIVFESIPLGLFIVAFVPKMKHLKRCRACGYKFDDRETKFESA